MVESYELKDSEGCPLCGCKEHTKKFARLYGYNVCKKCYYGFAIRRYVAYAIDELLIFGFLFTLLPTILVLLRKLGGNEYLLIFPLVSCLIILPLIKDGFGGYSFGKALLDLRVINEKNGQPIGPWRSLKRNFPTLNGLMFTRICFELHRGHRSGDDRAQSKVIWRKYSSYPVFLPKCSGGFDWLQEKREVEGEKKEEINGRKILSKAIKAEIKGNWDEAYVLYNKIMSDCPSAEVAHDAEVAMNALENRISEMTAGQKE